MQHARRSFVVGLVAVLFVLSGYAKAQVLQQVPSNALMVVKVNKLKQTSDKLGAFLKQIGVVEMQPDLADPLATLQKKTGMVQGIDAARDMAFVLLDPGAGKNPNDKSMLFLIPVSDYKAFLGNFPGAKTEGAITEIQFPNEPEPGYATQWGKYVALTPNKENLAKKPTGITAPVLAAKELTNKDIVVYGNMAAIRAKVLPQFKTNRPQMIANLENHLTQLDESKKKYAPVIRVLANQALNALEAAVRDTQSASFSLHFAPEGIKTTLLTEFDPASYMGKTAAQVMNSNGTMLKGLPEGKYLLFGGGVQDPKLAGKIVDDFVGPAMAELKPLGADAKPIIDYINAIRNYVSAYDGNSVGLFAPTAPLGTESLVQQLAISHGNAKVMQTSFQQMIVSQQEVMRMLNPKAANAVMTLTPKAKTMDGVTFDQISTQFNADPQNPQEMQAAQMLKFVYGPNGNTGFVGALNDTQTLIAMGLNDVQLGKSIAAARAAQDVLGQTPAVKTVAANLPAKRVVVIYVSVDTIVSTALNYARNFGLPFNMQIPADQPPVGVTVATEGPAIRMDGYIPTQLIQTLVSAGIQAANPQIQGEIQPVEPGL
jgi:hypothetical protein